MYFLFVSIQFFFHLVFKVNSYFLNYAEDTTTQKLGQGKIERWVKYAEDDLIGLVDAQVPAPDADVHGSLGGGGEG